MKKLLTATILTSIAFSANAETKSDKKAEVKTEFKAPKLSYSDAQKIAVDAVKESIKVVETELEREEGEGWTYEVEVNAGNVVTEVEIDAETGKVLEMEAD